MAELTRLTLPEPPSANDYYRIAGGRIYRTKAAKDFVQNVKTRMSIARVQPISGSVDLRFFWYRPARIGDLDNRNKILLDALKHGAFGDDAKVRRLMCEISDDQPRRARVEVQVIPFVASEPEELFNVRFSQPRP